MVTSCVVFKIFHQITLNVNFSLKLLTSLVLFSWSANSKDSILIPTLRNREIMREQDGDNTEKVSPGDVVGKAIELIPGKGTYLAADSAGNKLIYASLTGCLTLSPHSQDKVIFLLFVFSFPWLLDCSTIWFKRDVGLAFEPILSFMVFQCLIFVIVI